METKTTTPIVKTITPAMVRPSALPFDGTIVAARKRRVEQEKRRQTVESSFKLSMWEAASLKREGKSDEAKALRVKASAAVTSAGFYVKSINGALEVC